MAAALALLLPSRLSVPRADPATLSEFAPVPGSSESAPGDLTTLSRGGGSAARSAPAPAKLSGAADAGRLGRPGDKAVSLKRCVGSPPRQSEDPLSPPCVPYFDGDNGGATSEGVTADEVTVAVWLSQDPAGTVEDLGGGDGPTPNSVPYRAYMSFFNARYQTYDRLVHFYAYYGGTTGVSPDQARSAITDMRGKLHPFAFGVPTLDVAPILADEATRQGLLTFAYDPFDRSLYSRGRPGLITFAPDLQDQASVTAGFVCRKLAGRPARYSGNPLDRGITRRIGLLTSEGNEFYTRFASELRDATRADCRVELREGVAVFDDLGATAIASLRQDGVTTVVLLGSPFLVRAWMQNATNQGWLPEWHLPSTTPISAADARQLDQSQARSMFATSYDYRRDAIAEQMRSLAYREGCPVALNRRRVPRPRSSTTR